LDECAFVPSLEVSVRENAKMTKGSTDKKQDSHPKAPKQAAERRRLQDELEDDEALEALKVLHADREAKATS
jgi:hypothetical protein